ncbi:MAG TPA: helix-turn-helix domain-containing protein [Candidatus Limnocylindrales bacterium]|nr:helix-turn-helix domain-containing protein [Candidatus Limnocylindrales bacterium]
MNEETATDKLSIGRFSRLTGLSIGALRHYDELDLLRPVEVDRWTGYRRYAQDQVPIGQAIARLRDLEVPLEEIRLLLGTDDPAEQRKRVADQAARVQARVDRQVRILHVLRQLSQGRDQLVTETAAATPADMLDADAHRRLAKALYNHVWTLLELPDRTQEQVDEMIAATHASAWHWSKSVGTLANAARGQWQIARVYATLGRGEPAVVHARRCLELAEAATEAGVADDWDVPSALEALARAQSVAGDRVAAAATLERAAQAAARISDSEDRQLIESDLASITA